MRSLLLIYLCIYPFICFANISKAHLVTLYNSLDQKNAVQHFAFYRLYSDSDEGKKALKKAWQLLSKHRTNFLEFDDALDIPKFDIETLISFVNRTPYDTPPSLTQHQVGVIESLADYLANRDLEGYSCLKIADLQNIPNEEIDLARALLLYQFKEDIYQIRCYEALLDLMALQIMAKLPQNASDKQKIYAINEFIFHEMKFRFPPHSEHAKDIDLYTFLPAVMDSRKGVCLGVSILYLTLAQRLDLPLQIITPTGHIYLSYQSNNAEINIETTARGIHIPTKQYFGINNTGLIKRNMKQVIGLNFINQASVALTNKRYEESLSLYQEALKYLPEDVLTQKLLTYNLLFLDKHKDAKPFLHKLSKLQDPSEIYGDTMLEDFLKGNIDAKGIEVIFERVDETRSSIEEKQQALICVLEKFPRFREGIFHLAVTWLQLNRHKEAYDTLKKYYEIDPNNPTVVYYLSYLSLDRMHFAKARSYFYELQQLIDKHPHKANCLKDIRYTLRLEGWKCS